MTPAGASLQESFVFGRGHVDHSSGRRERRLLRPSDSMDPQGAATAPATMGNEDLTASAARSLMSDEER